MCEEYLDEDASDDPDDPVPLKEDATLMERFINDWHAGDPTITIEINAGTYFTTNDPPRPKEKDISQKLLDFLEEW